MKKMNKKGFTIVELVIVIAVIAILAAVLIPTFSSIVDKAQNSATIQEANAVYKMYVADVDYANGKEALQNFVIKVDGKFVAVKGAQMQNVVYTSVEEAAKTGAGLTAEVEDPADATGFTGNDYYIVEKEGETVKVTGAELVNPVTPEDVD